MAKGIKVKTCSLKTWNRVTKASLKRVIKVIKHYGLMSMNSTADVTFALRILMGIHREKQIQRQ